MAGQVHGDLAGEDDVCGAFFRLHVGGFEVEVFGDKLLNFLDSDAVGGFFLEDIFEEFFDSWDIEGFAFHEFGIADDSCKGTFHTADVSGDAFC